MTKTQNKETAENKKKKTEAKHKIWTRSKKNIKYKIKNDE